MLVEGAREEGLIFTFHYGQIYYELLHNEEFDNENIYIPLWLDLLLAKSKGLGYRYANLHSTMVRFIMTALQVIKITYTTFTFHYGQIYYFQRQSEQAQQERIYIPLWLDLLYKLLFRAKHERVYLHSTMVRFIITILKLFNDYLN